MNWNIFLSLTSIVGTAIAWVYFAKVNKAAKQIANDNALIKNISDTNEEWKELYEEEKSKVSKYEIKYEEQRLLVESLHKTIDSLYADVTKHRNEKVELREKLTQVQVINAELKLKECDIRKCPRRHPPSDY